MKLKYIALIGFTILLSCKEQLTPIGNTSVSVFKNTNLHFNLDFKSNSSLPSDSILRLDAGRVILKKIKLPNYKLQPKAKINVTLTSNGDPWDKSGSLFIIPKNSDISLLDFENGSFNLTQLKENYPAMISLKNDTLNYAPNIELLRFMTPFGVGHFNTSERIKTRKPIYIPHWEEEVTWSQDISHILPLLEDEIYIGAYIDTWTKEGYNISASIDFKESTIPNHKKKLQTVIPLVNTIKYAAAQRHFDGFSKNAITVDFSIDKPIKNAKLYYITTGHGGHAEGDEFVKKENIISLNNTVIKQFTPWRDDCASFRRFNPTSGVWERDIEWNGKPSKERLASSDLSRSNWCPGSDVAPEIIPLENLPIGNHTLKIEIPEAQIAKDNENNYWMVSAYIVYDN